MGEGVVASEQKHPAEGLIAEGGSPDRIIDALERTAHSSWHNVAARSPSFDCLRSLIDTMLPRYGAKLADAPRNRLKKSASSWGQSSRLRPAR